MGDDCCGNEAWRGRLCPWAKRERERAERAESVAHAAQRYIHHDHEGDCSAESVSARNLCYGCAELWAAWQDATTLWLAAIDKEAADD